MSNKFLFSIGILLTLAVSLSGKDKDQPFYPATTISDAMKKDAYAVCREYRHEFELIEYGKATEKVHMVITILEENGDHFGKLALPYDKSEKIKSISGRIYNGAGISEDKLKNAEILDVNYTSNGAMYDDIRFKPVSYTHLRAHETRHDLVCRL